MEPIHWTDPQRLALEAEGCDLVVSAAAGSGKTAVLTHRIVRLLEEGKLDAARLAVVTFTKAAASELEQKLYGILSQRVAEEPENEILSRALFRLSRARISTIHSFCFGLIREHRRELGLADSLRIADPNEANLLLRRAAEEALEAFLTQEEPEERAAREELFRLFHRSGKEDGLLQEVEAILRRVSSLPRGLAFLQDRLTALESETAALEAGELSFGQTVGGKSFCREAALFCRALGEQVKALLPVTEEGVFLAQNYAPLCREMMENLEEAAVLLTRGQPFKAGAFLELVQGVSFSRKRCPEEEACRKEAVKTVLQKVREESRNFCRDYLSRTAADLTQEAVESCRSLRRLLLLLEETEARYRAAKEKKGILDYSDLEQLALKLVWEETPEGEKKTAAGEEITRSLQAVFVDEYQDTNEIQDRIFRAVTNGSNLFLVGDPKQSIYRFRGAEPSIFTRYKKESLPYPEGDGGMQKILLSHNFRCDPSVIQLVNRLFCILMAQEDPDTLYASEDRLVFAKDNDEASLPAELLLVEKRETDPRSSEEDEEGVEEAAESREAQVIAHRILSFLTGGEGKLYAPSDIAVICRAKTELESVRRALTARGIPVSAGALGDRRDDPEYLFVTSLLQTVENPVLDIPLLGALSSPVFRFSDDDLLALRKTCPKGNFYGAVIAASRGEDALSLRCREFLEELSLLRKQSRRFGPASLLFFLYRRYSLEEVYEKNGASGGLRSFFLNTAATAHSCGYGDLSSYLRYLESMEDEGEAVEGDGVKIMTIHKSKGLEFPVVFVSFLGKRFNAEDEKKPVHLCPEQGLVLSLPRLSGRARYATAARKGALMRHRRANREEELRILYVALTRAREKLILTGTYSDWDKKTVHSRLAFPFPDPGHRAALTGQMTDPLSAVLFALGEREETRLALLEKRAFREADFSVSFPEEPPLRERWEPAQEETTALSFEEALPALQFSYVAKELETLPKKLSVSEILKAHREEEAPELYPRRLTEFQRSGLKKTAADVGTATHRVMQFIRLDRGREALEEELSRLSAEGYLSPEELALVDREALRRFFASSLYEEMAQSPCVEHERRFNVLFPASSLLGREGEVLVQGVVDAWFENPDGTLTLLDFKTDRVKPEDGAELLRRHGEQLRLYRRAVEEMTGKTVSRLLLYSFSLSSAVEVPPEE